MPAASPATFALLGLLATRSWTGYELTQQVQRSIRFAWPTSDAHVYREQKRLVTLGWATVEDEVVGRRTRNRYAITEDGRRALHDWLATEPREPQLHIEGVLRAFYADRGELDDLQRSMQATADMARSLCDEMRGFAAEYLAEDGPMQMLELGIGGPDDERLEFHGRPMFPERLHVVALAMEAITQMLATIEEFFDSTAGEVEDWPTLTDPSLTASTRARLERIAGT